MARDPPVVVARRTSVERERRASFFALLKAINLKNAVVFPRSFGMSTVEQRLTMNCLDEITGRYADSTFLLTFSVCYVLRNRTATNVFRRYCFPLYLSLVGYDCGLRSGSVCPATTFWNTVPHLDSNLGELARSVYMPDVFYEAPSSSPLMISDGRPRRVSYWSWVGGSIFFIAKSLFLPNLMADVFKGTCYGRQLTNNSTQTALIINNRFFRWALFDIRHTLEDDTVNFRAEIALLPRLEASRSLRWAYRCRSVVLTNSSLPARAWYSAHFTVMRFLRLDKETQ